MKTMKTMKSLAYLTFLTFGTFQLNGQALLWEISGNGLSEKSYLFGSIHIQDKRVFQLNAEVWNRFEKSTNFALECDIESINQDEIAGQMMMPKSYSELLSEEDYQLLEKVIEEYTEVPFLAIEQMKPFFVSMLISQSVLAMDEEVPLDLYILRKAREAKKTVLELETFNEQMNIVDQISFDEQMNALLKLIREPDLETNLHADAEKLISAYLSQDDANLYKLILETDNSEAFMKQFLINRNQNMLKKIKTFIAGGSTFIVVGAGHLPGGDGLVALLKKAGYALTPVKF